MSGEIDVTNDQYVGADGHGRIVVAMPRALMTRAEALRHAAWLVTVADPGGTEFGRVLGAVRAK